MGVTETMRPLALIGLLMLALLPNSLRAQEAPSTPPQEREGIASAPS
ncbi:MAG: hypothetical protein RRB24_04780 [Armatimonadota bacterium]|jgi:hypothetical protein|nr:hypothetical protein [Armatimonadota bacterium]MDT7972125.1 hypothetical protein [Armatimonadota bacterium]